MDCRIFNLCTRAFCMRPCSCREPWFVTVSLMQRTVCGVQSLYRVLSPGKLPTVGLPSLAWNSHQSMWWPYDFWQWVLSLCAPPPNFIFQSALDNEIMLKKFFADVTESGLGYGTSYNREKNIVPMRVTGISSMWKVLREREREVLRLKWKVDTVKLLAQECILVMNITASYSFIILSHDIWGWVFMLGNADSPLLSFLKIQPSSNEIILEQF